MVRIIFTVAVSLAVIAIVLSAPSPQNKDDSSEYLQAGSASLPVQVANGTANNTGNAAATSGQAAINLVSATDAGTSEWAGAASQENCNPCGGDTASISEGAASGGADAISIVDANASGLNPSASGTSNASSGSGGAVLDTGTDGLIFISQQNSTKSAV